MKKAKVVILGSTGSIGCNALSVLSEVNDKEIYGLSCNTDIIKLEKQIIKYKPSFACVYDELSASKLKERLDKKHVNTRIFTGIEGLCSLASLKEADMIIISVVGMIGIRPTIEAVKAKKIVCLANKESLVCAGDIIMPLAKKNKVEIRPIDSEHSAIWQCLRGENKDTIESLIITASGGPFYKKTLKELKNVKLEDALKHPNWSMGKKITIDSSTLVNKGLEVIEAHHLFNMPYDKIKVVVQRESIIHSMVQFKDGAIKAELGVPSMKVPIEYAIYKENRKPIKEKRIDFEKLKSISIDTVDLKTFKGLSLAYKAISKGGLMPSVFNALNEVAVSKFLNGERYKGKDFSYLDIVDFIEKGMKNFEKKGLNKKNFTIKDIEDTFKYAKSF